MKKQLSALFVMSLFLVSIASAFVNYIGTPLGPHNVGGRVTHNGVPVSNAVVTLKNLRTNVFDERTTNFGGEYVFELSNFKVNSDFELPYNLGDQVLVTVLGASKTHTLSGGSGFVGFELSDVNVITCPDGTKVVAGSSCPVTPTPTPTPVDTTIKVSSNNAKTEASFDVAYGKEFEVSVADEKLIHLKDGDLRFDGNDYKVTEKVLVKGKVQTSIDNVDFTTPRFVVEKEGVKYVYTFVEPIDEDDVSDENPLELVLLGKSLKIIDVDTDKLVVEDGKEKFLDTGKCEGDVCVVRVGQEVVRISVKGVEADISLGKVKEINGVEVHVKDVWESTSTTVAGATLVFGDDVKREIDKKDGYRNNDDDWDLDFVLESNKLKSITIYNSKSYTKAKDTTSSNYLALKEGEEIALPNNFAFVSFSSTTKYETVKLGLELDNGFLYISGDLDDSFTVNGEEENELWIKDSGFYDGDFKLLTTSKVRIGESNTFLELGSLKIGKLTIKTDLSDILYDGKSYAAEDDAFMDHVGLIFVDPENAVKDKEFSVEVPNTDSDIEASIVVSKETKEVSEQPSKPEVTPKPEVPETEIPEEEETPETPEEPEERPTPEPSRPVTPEPKGSNVWVWIIGVIVVIAGIVGYLYKNKKLPVNGKKK